MIQHPSSFLLTFFFVGSIIDPVITPVDPEPTEGTKTDPTDTVEPTDDGMVDNHQAIITDKMNS
jgi:hypothetical protein